jgi:hypothetical protein
MPAGNTTMDMKKSTTEGDGKKTREIVNEPTPA